MQCVNLSACLKTVINFWTNPCSWIWFKPLAEGKRVTYQPAKVL